MSSTAAKPEPDMNQRLPVVPAAAATLIPDPTDPMYGLHTNPPHNSLIPRSPVSEPAPTPKPSNAADDDDDEVDTSDLFDEVSIIILGLGTVYGIYAILNSFFAYLGTFSTLARLFIGLAIFASALHLVPIIFNDDGDDDSLLLPVWRRVRRVLPKGAEVREYVGRTWPMTMVSAGNVNGGLCAAAVYASVWHARGWGWDGVTAACVVFWVVLVQALGSEIVSSGWLGE